MTPRVPIGVDDFQKLRELDLEYIDKTDLIRLLIDRAGVEAMLLPRPRRFGKTLNLTMLKCWFEKRDEDLSRLFEGLSIWQAGGAYRAHFQRYPVIHFNFKGARGNSLEETLTTICRKIAVLFEEHRSLLEGDLLTEREARDYRAVIDGSADQTVYHQSLLDLSAYLRRRHGERVVILIDEYDEPIHASHVHGHAPQILEFMRAFLGAALKSNPHLFKAVMTGILRVAKENLFSGLNNLGVYSLLHPDFNTCFGFTEPEVTSLLERCGRADRMDEVRLWYNGYLFGGQIIYNPWSVLSYLDSSDAVPRPYWLSTSSNDLVKELLQHNAVKLQPVIEELLDGGSVERILEENVAMSELYWNDNAVWSLLVFSGYLKAEQRYLGPGEQPAHVLSIPNREIRLVYTSTFQQWMAARMQGHNGSLDHLTRALLGGDAETLEEQLQAFMTDVLSYHDTAGAMPENVYHAFVVGLLSVLERTHEVRSNRESGAGRPDVLIRPRRPGSPGVVLELKVAKRRKKTLEQALAEGLSQLTSMDYSADLRAMGASPVHAFAVAFDGKEVRVTAASAAAP